MTTSVDVLAEMERASSRLFDAGLHRDLSLDVARDAVAELVEAAERLVDSANPETQGWSEAVAAIARVKGA